MDKNPSANDPSAVEAGGAQALPRTASDRQLPLGWLIPWLLALVGILITLALTR